MSKIFPRGLFRSTSKIGTLSAGLGLAAALSASGCLERPVQKIEPNTSNFFVQKIINQEIDKIDLLFIVDNSTSMADKQAILEKAVPKMVDRLVTPDCINEETGARSAPVAGECAAGSIQEFKPVNNIHIGVITSSIGGHGSDQCRNTENNIVPPGSPPHQNDRGLLIPKVRKKILQMSTDANIVPPIPVPTSPHSAEGFLVWRPTAIGDEPAGESNAATLSADFAVHVRAAWEQGCGFEAPLEAWYRFLIDPAPPLDMVVNNQESESTGPDPEVLAQRKAFLRADSLVAVILLSDENDCSVMDGGGYYANARSGWILSQAGVDPVTGESSRQPLAIATSACAANVNDPCCYSCFSGKPESCKNEAIQSECALVDKHPPFVPVTDDNPNNRCFDNKRRFGFDLLYPTQRYVDGLTKASIIDTHAATPVEVRNPLLVSDNGQQRDPSFVFFAAIVGVPWQDLATEETLKDPTRLEFLKADQLAKPMLVDGKEIDRWTILLGQPGLAADTSVCVENPKDPRCLSAKTTASGAKCTDNPTDPACLPVAPLDPFMIESIVPRTAGATNPITGDKVVPIGSAEFNAINGREWDATQAGGGNGDLQYSCIFDLKTFGGVKTGCTAATPACDCGDGISKPLCEGSDQVYGKAYPGTRFLQVLRDFGENAIVASICPKVADPLASDFGYNPAVNAIISRLAEKLGGQCLPRKVKVDKETGVPCRILEAVNPAVGVADCTINGRQVAGASDKDPKDTKVKLESAVQDQLAELGLCTGDECKAWQMCEIRAVSEAASVDSCLNQPDYVGTEAGYCYIDPAQHLGSDTLVQQCDATKRQQIRFVTNDDNVKIPRKDAVTFIACTADQFQ